MQLLKELRHFPDFVKWSHSVFALPFALAALVLAARGFPGWRALGLVVAAVAAARTAAMAFNRIVDRRFDARNPRTADRHLPSGKISLPTAWAIVIVFAGLFVAIAFCINRLAGWLSPVALSFVLGYSMTKRFTHFSHFFLGAALGLAPLGAWVAVRADLSDPAPWLLAGAVVCWVAGFDIIYALQDADFDRRQGLFSMVVALGPERSLGFVRILHGSMLLILAGVGVSLGLKGAYFGGLIFVLASLIWEQVLIRRRDQGNLQWAFLQANAGASFGYLAAAVMGIFL